jgi:hypothetical protein
MVKFWYKRVKSGKAKVEDVPDLWREDVQKLIDAEAK